MPKFGMLYDCDEESTVDVACRTYTEMISNHFMSYQKFSRCYIFYDQSRVDDLTMHFKLNLLHVHWVCSLGFGQSKSVKYVRNWCCSQISLGAKLLASLQLHIFILFIEELAHSWQLGVSCDLCQQSRWGIHMYHAAFWFLATSYQKCVRV
jgi:hypothetical protein